MKIKHYVIFLILISSIFVLYLKEINKNFVFSDDIEIEYVLISKPFQCETLLDSRIEDNKANTLKKIFLEYEYQEKNSICYSSFFNGSNEQIMITLYYHNKQENDRLNYITISNEHEQIFVTINNVSNTYLPKGSESLELNKKVLNTLLTEEISYEMSSTN